MRNSIVSFLICLTLITCDTKTEQKKFDSFDFSYNDFFTTSFSIKFTHGDTVYIKQHFSFSDSTLETNNYTSVLSTADRLKLDSFLSIINFNTYDSVYSDKHYQDGEEYKFYLMKDTTTKTIYIHSQKAPKEIEEFGQWIVEVKERLELTRTENKTVFGSLKHFLPPEIEAPDLE